MKKLFSLIITICCVLSAFAQVAPDKYWIKFTDKNNSPYSVNNPEQFLSQRAISRRLLFGIGVVENDLPVNPQYIDSVANTGVTILSVSKWFNSVTIFTTDENAIELISQFPFVHSVTSARKNKSISEYPIDPKPFFFNESYSIPREIFQDPAFSGKSYNYGNAFNQIHMLNGEALHDLGFDGQGIIIAVLDAGFANADILSAFDSLWINGQILGSRDFVNPLSPDIFGSHPHGSMVLATMGANLPGQIVGTAPKAGYWLIRTEDGGSEFLIEELNWVSGAEFADSLGANIINSSLGYTTFNDAGQDHSYEDMDGNTTPVTIGADLAVSKGMIVVNSAGNSGNSQWHFIGAPADGDSVFSIGAVDANGNYAQFSSTGPTSDGRIKPNVVAQGQASATIDPQTGSVLYGNGTSFSSPITAGLVACLWQANPAKRNTDIMEAIQFSASQANDPDSLLGYGIPDYGLANSILSVIQYIENPSLSLNIFPNPFEDEINIQINDKTASDLVQAEILDIAGRSVILSIQPSLNGQIIISDLSELNAGLFILKVALGHSIETRVILKM